MERGKVFPREFLLHLIVEGMNLHIETLKQILLTAKN